MKKVFLTASLLLACVTFVLVSSSFAQVGRDLSGPHYNLNIIGVPHDKTADMTGSNRHTLFVPLDTRGRVPNKVKIYFIAGEEFRVIDGNATDDNQAMVEVPHGDPGTVCYYAFAVALGKPMAHGDTTYVNANVIFDESTNDVMLTLDMVSFKAVRGKGQPVVMDISNIFRVSGCIDYGPTPDGVCDVNFNNEWVFNIEELLSYWWDYENQGLKLLQVRFYDCYGHMAQESAEPAPAQPATWGSIKALYR